MTTGAQIEAEQRVRSYSSQCSDLGRRHSCLSQQTSRDPCQQLCPPAGLSWKFCLTRELSWQFCHLGSLANKIYKPWSLFYGPAWAKKLIHSPVRLLSTASSPAWPGSLARERGHPQSPSHSSQQPCPSVTCSHWPCISREPEQWPWAASETSLTVEPSLPLTSEPEQWPWPNRDTACPWRPTADLCSTSSWADFWRSFPAEANPYNLEEVTAYSNAQITNARNQRSWRIRQRWHQWC